MLQGYPTRNGTGISIFGDYGDLSSLHKTVHDIASTLNESNKYQKGQSQLLMNFAYEIRKAYSGQRLEDKLTYDGDDKEMHYYGFKCVWTDMLIFISAIRKNAGYYQTDRLHQANIYLLEYVVENALFNYDAQGANEIKHFIGQKIHVTDPLVFAIYQAIHIKFVSDTKGKKRFRKIPSLLVDYFSMWQPAYKDLVISLEKSAKLNNCKIEDLEFNDFPEIEW